MRCQQLAIVMGVVVLRILLCPLPALAGTRIEILPLLGDDPRLLRRLEEKMIVSLTEESSHPSVAGHRLEITPAAVARCEMDAACLLSLVEGGVPPADYLLTGRLAALFPNRYQYAMFLVARERGGIIGTATGSCFCTESKVLREVGQSAVRLLAKAEQPPLGPEERHRRYISERKSYWKAIGVQIFPGLLFPGAGEIYAGETLRGIAVGVASLAGFATFAAVPESKWETTVLEDVGLLTYLGGWSFGMIDSVVAVNRSNRALADMYRVSLVPLGHDKLALSLTAEW